MSSAYVREVHTYVALAAIRADLGKLLFCGTVNTKVGVTLPPSGGLRYTRVRELLLEKIGLDKSKYRLHSLQSGGVGVPDCWFKRHGRWRTENAKDGYVKDKFEDKTRSYSCRLPAGIVYIDINN